MVYIKLRRGSRVIRKGRTPFEPVLSQRQRDRNRICEYRNRSINFDVRGGNLSVLRPLNEDTLAYLDRRVVGSFMTMTSVMSPYLVKYSLRLSVIIKRRCFIFRNSFLFL